MAGGGGAGLRPVQPPPASDAIGVPRFELGTSPTRTERATRLRHTPRSHRLAQVAFCDRADTDQSHLRGYVASTANEGGCVNSVVLTGNLATDVEVKELSEERQVATFVLAVDRVGGDEADFFRISAWNKQAQLCGQ